MLIELSKDQLEMLLEIYSDVEERLTPQEIDLYEILLDAFESYQYDLDLEGNFED